MMGGDIVINGILGSSTKIKIILFFGIPLLVLIGYLDSTIDGEYI